MKRGTRVSRRKRRQQTVVRPWGVQQGPKVQPYLVEHARIFVPFVVLAAAWVFGLVFGGSGFRVFVVCVCAAVGGMIYAVSVEKGRELLLAWVLPLWGALVAAFGMAKILLILLFFVWVGWAVWWWRGERAAKAGRLAEVWGQYVAGTAKDAAGRPIVTQSVALPGSKLVNERSGARGAMVADIVMPRGQGTTAMAIAAIPRVASAFEAPLAQINIEPHPTGRANYAVLMVMPRPATDEIVELKTPNLDLASGITRIGSYVDGEPEVYRWFNETGAVHELAAGTTGSGKSRLNDLLLATSRHAGQGRICDWVADPQMGQSLPDWVGNVDWFAKGVPAALNMLRAAYAVMIYRNKILASTPWTDDAGRARTGFNGFPLEQVYRLLGMPLLVVTLEEAPSILEIPEARSLAEKISKMGRKCGIKLRIVVQVPLLDQIGGSMTLREMLVSGQGFLFRTGGRMSGNVMFPGLPIDPYAIPREDEHGRTTAGIHYVQGASTRTALARTMFVRDAADWAMTGATTPLDAASASAAGDLYVNRHDEPDDDDVIVARPAAADTPPGGTVTALRVTCRDMVLAFLADGPKKQGEIAAHCFQRGQYAIKTVREALQTLRDANPPLIEKVGDDTYRLTKGA